MNSLSLRIEETINGISLISDRLSQRQQKRFDVLIDRLYDAIEHDEDIENAMCVLENEYSTQRDKLT